MYHEMNDKAQDMMQKGKKEMKESGRDWLEYIQEHPIQSIAFGATIIFAIKGMLQN